MHRILPIALLLVAGCATSDDPADGGFFSGVSGVTQGTYQERVDTLEATAEGERARQASLEAELAGLESELAGLRLQLTQQRSRLAAEGVSVPQETEQALVMTLRTEPEGRTDAERLEALRAAIGDARSLSRDLAALAS